MNFKDLIGGKSLLEPDEDNPYSLLSQAKEHGIPSLHPRLRGLLWQLMRSDTEEEVDKLTKQLYNFLTVECPCVHQATGQIIALSLYVTERNRQLVENGQDTLSWLILKSQSYINDVFLALIWAFIHRSDDRGH